MAGLQQDLPERGEARKRAWAQLVLGQVQMIGATAGLYLLLTTGINSLTTAVVGATAVVTVTSRVLLHGDGKRLRYWIMNKYVAEFLGTFGLVFAGTGAIVINEVSGGTVTHVGIALTFGLVVMAMIYTFGDISGAHLNPAVTLAFWAARRFDGRKVIPYILSQCGGAFLASTLLWFLFRESKTLGVTLPAGSATQSLVLELVLSFLLMLVILSVSTGDKEKGITAGIAVGATIGLEAMFAGPICGASMNPARSLAPAVVSGNLHLLWVYLAAPILGTLMATVACRCVREKGCCGGAASAPV